jgi:Raf kinase inhibitor-like YbhB/YbcL family protein
LKRIDVTSDKFEQDGWIPAKYTCQGENISPPLHFKGVPSQAMSLCIIMDDPDAPVGVFDHWLAWNIPATTSTLPEGGRVPSLGMNHFGQYNYKGPCPPKGMPHHYHFRVYALDRELALQEGSNRRELETLMKDHIVAYGELVGLYQR